MKNRLTTLFGVAALLCASVAVTEASTIKDKVIKYSAGSYLAGQPLPLGNDPYGYNYQARSFAGSYFNAYANSDNFPPYKGDDASYLATNPTAAGHWAWPYRNDQVAMKWNDSWLSNEDRDGDGKLDRHYGFPAYIGSGAWINNHQSGEYTADGQDYSWNYMVKIVAVPSSAGQALGFWFDNSGGEIGAVIWDEFATTQEVYNDTGTGDHGVLYHSPVGPGLGKYGPRGN